MRTELTSVPITAAAPLVLYEGAGAAGALDLLPRALREAVCAHGQLLRELADAEDLDRHVLARREPALGERRRRDLGTVVEARVEVAQVHGLRVRAAELLERHRLLHRRTAQLAQAHVERHLAALEVHGVAVARACAPALVPAARGLPRARALAAADALLAVARALRGLKRMETDLVRHYSSTLTRWRTVWMAPRTVGSSGRSVERPILPRPSVRKVSRWRGFAPFEDLN